MAYVIAEPCVGTCDTACVGVCPVDCIHGPFDPSGHAAEAENLDSREGLQLYIDAFACVDCGACEPECPVAAIFHCDDLPAEWVDYIAKSEKFFAGAL
jgi:ferredoxin